MLGWAVVHHHGQAVFLGWTEVHPGGGGLASNHHLGVSPCLAGVQLLGLALGLCLVVPYSQAKSPGWAVAHLEGLASHHD